MCRAFEETRKEGIAIGLEQGLAQGLEQGLAQGKEREMRNMLAIIGHLMKEQNLTAKAAMDMLGLPSDEQAKYMEKLN